MLFYMIALSASEKEVKLQYVERLAYGNADLKLHFSRILAQIFRHQIQ
jgi:hypothetical protein